MFKWKVCKNQNLKPLIIRQLQWLCKIKVQSEQEIFSDIKILYNDKRSVHLEDIIWNIYAHLVDILKSIPASHPRHLYFLKFISFYSLFQHGTRDGMCNKKHKTDMMPILTIGYKQLSENLQTLLNF